MRDAPAGAPLRALRVAAAIVAVIAAYGIGGRLYLIVSGRAGVNLESPFNIFFRLYALHEQPFLVLTLAFALLVLACDIGGVAWRAAALERLVAGAQRVSVWTAAAVVLTVTAIGSDLVMHGVPLSMDEFGAWFQARIFASGRLRAPIPELWRPLSSWMTPIFVTLTPDGHWISSYLPMYAAMRALLSLARVEWLTNPLLAAGSVLLLHAVARRLWPGGDRRPLLAVALLVTSSQFVLMSMSGYSMPAHLFLNLLWFWLYLRDDTRSLLALPLVGVVAMGLHNPFPHALFAAPFLLRFLLQRRWVWVAYLGAVYLGGAAGWLAWLGFAQPPNPAQAGASLWSGFMLPNGTMRFTHVLNLSLVFTWQTPVLAVLLLAAVGCWRRLSVHERGLAAGVLASFAFYLLFPVNQGHGWGYRYVYGALGSIMLLGATGAMLAARAFPRGTVLGLIASSLVLSAAVQLPLRMVQVESFVRPFARGHAFVASRPAALVAVDESAGWYGVDFLRNDPLFEQGPRVFFFRPRVGPNPVLIPEQLRDSVFVISRGAMARFGVPVLPQSDAPPAR